ncbi:sialate O-acetylesterase (plasmid) [Verrucomicrobiaceae bacterium 227]
MPSIPYKNTLFMNLRSTHLSKPSRLALSFWVFGAIANTSHADVIQVYLQGGQSNADGRGNPNGLPTSPVNFQQPQSDVAFFFHTQGSAHALDSTLTTLRPGMSETNGFGPEITFGRDLADSFADTPTTSVAIIKYANGGTNLHSQWKAGGDASTTGDGAEYVTFQNTVTAGLAAITAANPGDTITIAGMIWHQGESDNSSSTTAAAYEANLTNFLADVRATYGADLPIVIGEIAVNGGDSNTQTIRTAQATVAAANPLNGFLDVDSFNMQDALHFSPTGQMSLGSGFASELLGLQEPTGATIVTPTADTYIRDSNPTTNYGSDIFMVANNNGSSARIAIFNFDLSPLTPGAISSANLKLEDVVGNATQSYEIWGLLDAHETFEEATLTWDTAGFLSGLSIDSAKAYGGAPLGTFDNIQNSINTIFNATNGTFLDFLNASEDADVTFVIVDTDTGGGGTGWATKEDEDALIPTLTLTDGSVDSTPPTPNPMTFASAPSSLDYATITMTATTGTDENGVQYFFENTSGGGNDSGWQDSAVYVDRGLLPGTEYSYQVKARDKSPGQNETDFSAPESTTTAPATLITSAADTYIRDSNSTTNYGSDSFMVANDNGNSVRMAIFNFDLATAPPGTIETAQLQLEDVIGDATQNYEIWGLLDAHETFNESTLTWDTTGFLSDSGRSVDPAKAYGGVPLGTFDNTQNSINTAFNVISGAFLDFLNASADNDVTFVVVDPNPSGPGTGWATKENGSALIPTLTLTTGAAPGYTDWTASYPDLDLTDPNADLDLDGISNALESWFGTHPGEWNAGVSTASTDTTTSTFTHPRNPTPPGDVTASYQWSLNLLDWYDSENGPVDGPTAMIVPNTVESTTTVTLTASEVIPKLFLRVTTGLSAP